MTAVEQTPETGVAPSTFRDALQLRVQEAQTSLAAAEALGDPLLAQIAEADLADLRALAARNDITLP
ncbi:MAG: hypothetical protein KY438_10425 [Actinobacteria bacterium]|nr:hypothetical protein [Actinomycetota bacterium]